MFAGTSGREIDDIKVDYNKSPHVPDYVTVQLWEPRDMGSFHIDMQPEKARELIEKLQAALPSPIAVHDGPPDERDCMAMSPRHLVCTLSEGHNGPHVAEGSPGQVFDRWPQAPQPIVSAHAQPDLETDVESTIPVFYEKTEPF